MASTNPIPPESDIERTEVSPTLLAAVNVLTTSQTRADLALLEQDNRAWLALPGLACHGGDWELCPDPATWMLRSFGKRGFCAYHAAERLRAFNKLAAVTS